jgi:CubicO group peptidase (beta-lactamase class C family)
VFFHGRSWGFWQAVYDSGAFGWDGGLGTSWLVDPSQDLTVIVVTQRMFESPDPPLVHRDIQGAAHAALARVPWTVSMFTAAKAMVVRPVPRLASVTLSVGWDYTRSRSAR